MRRRRGRDEGSIYKRGDGRWTGAVTLGYEAGKRKRKQLYGQTRKEVQQKLTKVLRDHEQGLPVPVGKETVGQFLGRWLKDVVSTSVRPSTYTSYSGLVKHHLDPVLGKVQLDKLTPEQVQAFLNDRQKRGLSPRTVQYLRAVLRRAINQALKWGQVARNVAALSEPPKMARPKVNPLTAQELEKFLQAARGTRFEALFVVAVTTGLRRGELLGLSWSDINLDAGELQVRHALQRIDGKLRLVEPKSANGRRSVRLTRMACAALRQHRVSQLEDKLAAGSRWVESGLVFTTSKGTPLDHATVVRSFHGTLEQGGLRHQRFHDLRHACATLMLSEDVNPRVVMEMLGHSQISLTLDTYSHVSSSLQDKAVARIDAALGGGQK